tara:strand:- start:4 stop:423 length:420 start_codon:yes stop_codon:yes gene_type:complete
MKIDLTDSQWSDIKLCLLMAISYTEKSSSIDFKDNPLIKRYLKTHDEIAVAMENEKKKQEKAESDPFDPYKRKYYAKLGFYQQLHAADMMGFKSEGTLVKYRKNGVLKEGIHWIRTMGRGISYKPEACKLAIQKAKNEK